MAKHTAPRSSQSSSKTVAAAETPQALAKNLARRKIDRRMIRFSRCLQDKIEETGKSIPAFCAAHNLTQATIYNYLDCKNIPELPMLWQLAEALRKELRDDTITMASLVYLLDFDTADGEIADWSELGVDVRGEELGRRLAERLLEEYDKINYDQRIEFLPKFQEVISRDVIFLTSPPQVVAAMLVEEEIRKQGGISTLLERSGLDEPFVSSIRDKKLTQFDVKKISVLADHVRDKNGQYGNVQLFLSLLGFQMNLSSLMDNLMSREGIKSLGGLADYLIARSNRSARVQRQRVVDEVRKLYHDSEWERLNRNPVVFDVVMGTLASELGFPSVDAMIEFLNNSPNGSAHR